MSNWYNLIETQLLQTIRADSWLGTAGTNIATVEARLRPGPRNYYDYELPAIAIKVLGLRQDDWSMGVYDRFYQFVIFILARGGDMDAIVNTTQKIASVLENLLEGQHDTANNLQGLGTHAELQGGPFVDIGAAAVDYNADTETGYTVLCTLQGEVNIVA